jgi:hypothetical protein
MARTQASPERSHERLMLRLASLVLGFTMVLVLAGDARAGDATRLVIIFLERRSSALGRRLQQEVESLGLRAEARPLDGESRPAMVAALRERGVVAVLEIATEGSPGVEIDVVDPSEPSMIRHKRVGAREGEASSAELLATRTVEVLRADLMPIPKTITDMAPSINREPPSRAPNPSSTLASIERGPDVVIAGGAAVMESGSFSPSTDILVGGTITFGPGLGARVDAFFPMAPAHLSDDAGDVELSASIYRLSAIYDFGGAESALVFRLLAGVALARLHFAGAANAPSTSAEDDRLVFGPSAGVAAAFRLSANVRLTGEATALAAFPNTVVRLAGHEATAWGRPAATASVGVELSLPLFSDRRAKTAAAPSGTSR